MQESGRKEEAVGKGIKATLLGLVANACLATVKGVAGYLGNSYALIADAIESASDILASLVVFAGLKLATKPADENHPYGHGKFEPIAAIIVSLMMFTAAVIISLESVAEIKQPHHAPAPFTLLVLAAVILLKETLFRHVQDVGQSISSSAVKTDAWHHRSDAVTSLAAFIGISVAILGGPGYESADDFAALIAALVISLNAIRLLHPALNELLDAAPDRSIAERVREIAHAVPGVQGTHKCHVRKLGLDYFIDLDVLCEPELTIREGHEIAHDVGEAIHAAMPEVTKVLVHIEPSDDYAKRSRDTFGE